MTSARAEQSQQARAAPTLAVPVCFAFLVAPRTSILGLYLPHEITNLADLSAMHHGPLSCVVFIRRPTETRA